MKTTHTKSKDGMQGIKRYFTANTGDGNKFTFCFSKPKPTAVKSEAGTDAQVHMRSYDNRLAQHWLFIANR